MLVASYDAYLTHKLRRIHPAFSHKTMIWFVTWRRERTYDDDVYDDDAKRDDQEHRDATAGPGKHFRKATLRIFFLILLFKMAHSGALCIYERRRGPKRRGVQGNLPFFPPPWRAWWRQCMMMTTHEKETWRRPWRKSETSTKKRRTTRRVTLTHDDVRWRHATIDERRLMTTTMTIKCSRKFLLQS